MEHPYKKSQFGKWELYISCNADGSCPIKHLSEVKIIIQDKNGHLIERLSPWATYVTQPKNPSDGTTYKQTLWCPGPQKVRTTLYSNEPHEQLKSNIV